MRALIHPLDPPCLLSGGRFLFVCSCLFNSRAGGCWNKGAWWMSRVKPPLRLSIQRAPPKKYTPCLRSTQLCDEQRLTQAVWALHMKSCHSCKVSRAAAQPKLSAFLQPSYNKMLSLLFDCLFVLQMATALPLIVINFLLFAKLTFWL